LSKISTDFYDTYRKPVARSLGCHFEGAALPKPDLNYAPDQVAGCTKRVAADMPPINRVKLRKFKRFVLRWCKKNLSKYIFKHDEAFDFEEWLESAPYPLYRKNELRKIFENSVHKKNNKNKKVKSFIKDETYPEYKHVRGIYSRHDEYKCEVGPFFKKVGNIIFSLPEFIKKVPVNNRPAWLLNKYGDNPNLFCTDFSQFEATFVEQLMRVELIVYRYLLQNHPMRKEIIDSIVSGMMSVNHIQFHKWSMKLMCKRMSGEMSTSVSNGFMNLLLTSFLLEEAGNKQYCCSIEGDDSLNSYDVRAPTSQEYLEMGANIKIEFPENLCEASFCGQIFDREDLDNVANPMEALVSFGWTRREYLFAKNKTLLELLRSKSLSMLYQYSGCPLLRSLALYGLRITKNIKDEDAISRFLKGKMESHFRKMQYQDLISDTNKIHVFSNVVKNNTRLLVERRYKISVAMQLDIEKYLDNKNDLSPIIYEPLKQYCHPHWIHYYDTYGVNCDSPDGRKGFKSIPTIEVSTGFKCKFFTDPVSFLSV